MFLGGKGKREKERVRRRAGEIGMRGRNMVPVSTTKSDPKIFSTNQVMVGHSIAFRQASKFHRCLDGISPKITAVLDFSLTKTEANRFSRRNLSAL